MTREGDSLPPINEKGPGTSFLIYDGDCSVCRGAVEWIRARSEPGAFEFLSCHEETFSSRFPFLDKNACLKAAHLVLSDGRVVAGERAAPEVFLRIPEYRWLARVLLAPGARFLSRVFYRGFARRRHSIASLFHSGHREA